MKTALLILLILIVLLLLLMVYFLVTPFHLVIDTRRGIYWAGWRYLANVDIDGVEENWGVNLHLFGWTRRYRIDEWALNRDPFGLRVSEKHEDGSGGEKRKKKGRESILSARRALRILRQFHMRRFRWELDTDDVIVNAYLTPVFEAIRFWSRGKYQTRINFTGRNSLEVNGDTRIINLIRAGYM